MSGSSGKNGSSQLMRLIKRASVVAFDAMVFIYHFEDYPRYADVTEKIFSLLGGGLVQGVTSITTVAEVFSNKKAADDINLVARYRAVFRDWPGLKIHYPTIDDAMVAGSLRIRYGLRLPDAFQVVAGLQFGAKVLVTNDREMRRVKEPKVVLLEDYLE